MLSDLIKIQKRIFQSSTYGGHSSQCRTLKLLALKQRLRIFEETNIIARYDFDEMFCRGELTEGYAEVVGIVKGIEEIFVERMDVLEAGKAIKNQRKLLGEGFLCKFDFSSVEICFNQLLKPGAEKIWSLLLILLI